MVVTPPFGPLPIKVSLRHEGLDGRWYVVLTVGGFATRAEAERLAAWMKSFAAPHEASPADPPVGGTLGGGERMPRVRVPRAEDGGG